MRAPIDVGAGGRLRRTTWAAESSTIHAEPAQREPAAGSHAWQPGRKRLFVVDAFDERATGEPCAPRATGAAAAEEICSFTWWSRMKESAGEDRKGRDPWWQGEPARRSRYFIDGRTERIEEGDKDEVGEVSHARVDSVATVRGGMSGPYTQVAAETQVAVEAARHGSREVPTKIVSRHANWGWIMDACWSVSTSFPMPRQGEDDSLEDDALPMTVQTQRDEAMAYNYGMDMPNAVGEPVGGTANGDGSDGSAVDPDAMLLARLLGA